MSLITWIRTSVPLSLTFNNGVSENGELLNWFYRLDTDIRAWSHGCCPSWRRTNRWPQLMEKKSEGRQCQSYLHHYNYGDNRFHCRYPWEIRDIQLEQENLYDLDNETRITVRKKQSSERIRTKVNSWSTFTQSSLWPVPQFRLSWSCFSLKTQASAVYMSIRLLRTITRRNLISTPSVNGLSNIHLFMKFPVFSAILLSGDLCKSGPGYFASGKSW